MTNKVSESFDIVGLITRRQDANGEEPSSLQQSVSSSKRKRKPVERIGTITGTNDPLLGEEDEDDEDDEDSSDGEFTPSTEKVSCVCQKNTKNTFMVNCNTCRGLYHGKCIGIDRSYHEAISQAGDVWFCPICASLDTGKDIDTFLLPPKNDSSKPAPSFKSSPASEAKEVDSDILTESIEIIGSGDDINSETRPVDPLSIVTYSESDILQRLSDKIPPDTTNEGDYHLFADPCYIPRLNECIAFISKAKSKDVPFCCSAPAKKDIKGGYIYVFKSDNDLLENLTNEGEWSIGDGFIFTNIVMKKYPITSSDIAIIERLESNSSSSFKRRAVWLSSDPSSIVVNYIGKVDSVVHDKDDDVELVILEDENHSLNETRPKAAPNLSKTLLSLPPGISVIMQPSSPSKESNAVTPKKQIIEIVDIASDDERTPPSSSKRRKKRLQYTPKRIMPNLPPKQCEYLKYRRKLCTDDEDQKTAKEEPTSENGCALKISNVQSLNGD